MFVNGVEAINSRLSSIKLEPLKITLNMHPNTEKTETCEKSKLPPALHVTPSSANQRKPDGSPNQRVNNPWLLNPQHEIPPTPPPQVDSKPTTFFQQRIG